MSDWYSIRGDAAALPTDPLNMKFRPASVSLASLLVKVAAIWQFILGILVIWSAISTSQLERLFKGQELAKYSDGRLWFTGLIAIFFGLILWNVAKSLKEGDNTARILDVKFHLLRPDGDPDAGVLDYFAWSEVLACIGAVRTYRRIYRASLDPMRVAELMMLRRDVPRSVHHCLWMVDLSMRELAETYGTRGEADRIAGELHARLRYARIDHVFDSGLHKFLGGVRDDIATLSNEIGRQFLLD